MAVLPFLGGHIADHPYVAWGVGDPLVVLPGLNDPLARVGDHWWFDTLAVSFCRHLSQTCRSAGAERRVYYVSRPIGLSSDASIGSMAKNYMSVMEALDQGCGVDVVGISMGGFLAPVLAAQSSRVRTVTLALAADRLSPHGATSIRKWREWAECNEWYRVGRAGTRAVARGSPRKVGTLGARLWSFNGGPIEPEDFLVSADACLKHDWNTSVEPPTLVIGGTEDPFFTTAAFARAAQALNACYTRLDGWGHDVVVHGGGTFARAIACFVAQPN